MIKDEECIEMPAPGIGEKCYPGYRTEVLFSDDVAFDMWTTRRSQARGQRVI